MGSADSKCIGERGGEQPVRNNGVYGGGGGASLTKDKLPMPDTDELERRFTKVLVRQSFIWPRNSVRSQCR